MMKEDFSRCSKKIQKWYKVEKNKYIKIKQIAGALINGTLFGIVGASMDMAKTMLDTGWCCHLCVSL